MSGLAAMGLDPATLAAIVGMAVASYACRGGGYWLFRQVRPPPWLRTTLGYVPGALFVAFVVPALAAGGVRQWVAALLTAGVMLGTGSLAAAVVAGTGASWLAWSMGWLA